MLVKEKKIKSFKKRRNKWFIYRVKSFRFTIGRGFLYYNPQLDLYERNVLKSPIKTKGVIVYLHNLNPNEAFWEAWRLSLKSKTPTLEYELN